MWTAYGSSVKNGSLTKAAADARILSRPGINKGARPSDPARRPPAVDRSQIERRFEAQKPTAYPDRRVATDPVPGATPAASAPAQQPSPMPTRTRLGCA